MGFVGVLSIIPNMVRKCTQVQWDDLLERVHPGGDALIYTKQSFAEALQNLPGPRRSRCSMTRSFRGVLCRDDYATYRGFRLPQLILRVFLVHWLYDRCGGDNLMSARTDAKDP